MFKKLSKVGNSRAIVLDKAILDLLKIDDNTRILLEISDGKLILEPIHRVAISDDEGLQSEYESIISEYDDALKKLAK